MVRVAGHRVLGEIQAGVKPGKEKSHEEMRKGVGAGQRARPGDEGLNQSHGHENNVRV